MWGHASTRYSPYYVIFGREQHLPVNLLCRADDADQPVADWPATHEEHLKVGEHL